MEEYKTNAGHGLGVAGFMAGLVALLICFIPCFGIMALVPGIIGITFSIIANNQAIKGNGARGFIIAALVISIIGSSVAVLQGFVGFPARHLFNKFENRGEINIEDQAEEDDSDFDEDMDKVGDDMEKILENLENKNDSIHIDIKIGEKLSDAEFDKLMKEYEGLIQQSRQISKSVSAGKEETALKYTELAIRLTSLHARLLANMGNLSPHQRDKLEEINEKYQKDLENLKK